MALYYYATRVFQGVDIISETKICPYCGEEIKAVAIKCKHCHSLLTDDSLPIEHGNSELSQQPLSNTTGAEKLQKAGSALTGIGCLLTIFITIPIILIFLFIGC